MKRGRSFYKKMQAAALAAAMTVTMLPVPSMQAGAQEGSSENPLQILFDEPAGKGTRIPGKAGGFGTTEEDDIWQQLTLPIGNGSIGANVYGEVSRERLTFNEKTLWNGGPSSSRPDYNGGNIANAGNGQSMAQVYQQIQEYYMEGNDSAANSLANLLVGESDGYGAYQSWGDIYLDYGFADDTSSNYSRNLDLLTAVSNVEFDKNQTTYRREYFISYPDQVMAIRLTAEGSEKMDLNISFPIDNGEDVTGRNLGKTVTTEAEGNRLTVAGQMQDNQLMLNGQILVASAGRGSVTPGKDNSSLQVTGADEIILYVAADTDYSDNYPVYRTGDTPEQLNNKVKALVDQAAAKGYGAVLAAHLSDYKEIFDRVSLDLGQGSQVSGKTTDDLLKGYREGSAGAAQQRLLETLLFQYGRYLTIASSREGDLPSNLQGIWQNRAGDHNRVPWGSDYHMNVNLQMNYWPTYSTNMIECATPLIDYINALKEPGKVTAENYFGVTEGGFTAHTQNTPFGWTCPGWNFSWGWSPAALPWILQNCYEYYEYSLDEEYLRTQIYPLLKESALLYDQILIEKDGRMVSAPAYSPEHGPVTAGNTYEQSLIWQLYEDAIHSAQVLGVDADKAAQWKETQSKLNPIEIGDSGQIKEWYTETTLGSIGEKGHRHMSHLLGLFPGDLISVDNAEYMDAAIISLTERGYSSTGWGVGQRINAWARTGKGDGAYKSIQSLLKEGIYPNLWDSHAPFQIDGNLGYTAGVAEILMQSNMNYINILPSLPSAWKDGHVSGLVARGNFEVSIDWTDASPYHIGITSRNGGDAVIQSENIAMATVTDSKGNPVAYTAVSNDRISFPTSKGESYTVTNIPFRGSLVAAPENLSAARNGKEAVGLSWDAVDGEAVTYAVYRRIEKGELIKLAEGLTDTKWEDTQAQDFLGTLQYQVQAVSGSGTAQLASELSGAVTVANETDRFGLVDDREELITYSDGWGTWAEDGLYNRTSTFVESPGGTETAEMTFTGTGVKIFATVNRDRGMADVYIDGQLHGTADSYAPSKTNFKEIYSVSGLPEGAHTIKVHVTNQKNPSSTKGKFEFDAFEIVNENKAIKQVSVNSVNGITTLSKENSTLQMEAVVDTRNSNKAVTWTAEPSSLAGIDENGLLSIGSISGKVTVTAASVQDPAKSGTIEINIQMPESVSSGDPVLDEGTIKEFNVAGPENQGGGTLNTDNIVWNGGGWGTWGGENGHYNGDKVDGTGAGSTVEFKFSGVKLEIYGAVNKTFSGFAPELDSVSQGDVYTDTQNDAKNVLLTSYEGLENKEHTVKLTVLSKDSRTKISLDYFKAYGLIENPNTGNLDKRELQDLIELHAGKLPECYTQESFAPFQQALAGAVAVMNNLQAQEEDVQSAITLLQNAVPGLVEVQAPGPQLPSGGVISTAGVESTTMVLTWPAAENAVKYRILNSANEVIGETSLTYYRVKGLTPDTDYTFRVEAVNRAGSVSAYPELSTRTLGIADTAAPEPVTDLVWNKDEGKVFWNKSQSEDVSYYEVWVNGRKEATVDKESALAYLVTDWKDGTYTVSVSAVDKSGNKSRPVSISFTLGGTQPPAADVVVTEIAAIEDIQVYTGTEFMNLGLPQGIKVTLSNGQQQSMGIVWSEGNYQALVPGSYQLTGELVLTDQVTNPQGLKAAVKVVVTEEPQKPENKPDITNIQQQSLTVAYGSTQAYVQTRLPAVVTAELTDSEGKISKADVRVTWQENPDFDGGRPGVYEFTGVIAADSSYTNTSDRKAFAFVMVKESGQNQGGSSSTEDSAPDVDWNKVTDLTADMVREVRQQVNMVNGSRENVLNIVTGSNAYVPANILESIKGNPVVIAFHTGKKLTFSINGRDISKSASVMKTSLNLSVRQGDSLIPSEITAQKTQGAITSRQFETAHQGSFGLKINLHLDMGKENAGQYANLYCYNKQKGRLEYQGSFKIVDSGQAMFGITQGAGYLVTVTSEKEKEVITRVYQVNKGDTLSGIAAKHQIPLRDLIAMNPQLTDLNRIRTNQKIYIR